LERGGAEIIGMKKRFPKGYWDRGRGRGKFYRGCSYTGIEIPEVKIRPSKGFLKGGKHRGK